MADNFIVFLLDVDGRHEVEPDGNVKVLVICKYSTHCTLFVSNDIT